MKTKKKDIEGWQVARKGLTRRMETLKKEVLPILSVFTVAQLVDLLIIIDESLDVYGKSVSEDVFFGETSGLDLLMGYYNDLADYIETDVEDWDIPDEVDTLQLFALYSFSLYLKGIAYLNAPQVDASISGLFGSEDAAALTFAGDSIIEASQALMFGYAEFKRENNYLTDVEKSNKRGESLKKRASSGGRGKAKIYAPLRKKAGELCHDLIEKHQSFKPFKFAGEILDELIPFAVEIEWYQSGNGEERELPAQETVCRWLKKDMQKEQLKKQLSGIVNN